MATGAAATAEPVKAQRGAQALPRVAAQKHIGSAAQRLPRQNGLQQLGPASALTGMVFVYGPEQRVGEGAVGVDALDVVDDSQELSTMQLSMS